MKPGLNETKSNEEKEVRNKLSTPDEVGLGKARNKDGGLAAVDFNGSEEIWLTRSE